MNGAVQYVRLLLFSQFSDALRKKLSRMAVPQATVTISMQIQVEVFLALFATMQKWAGETFVSLASRKRSARTISFEELDTVFSPVCARWHTRTAVLGHSAFVDITKRSRVSLELMNSDNFDHSACPRCTYPLDAPILGKSLV